ncbi:MAG: aspartate--tRNA ligase [Proteobacteria bacterium]|nr:aspartate--tRNA ligase [Pseudomonadota bacterium]
MHPYRTHTCGELRDENAGETVRLSGWIHRKRDHGNLLFVDLRDQYGITQCVIDTSSPIFETVESARLESVITVTGPVVARSAETVNAALPTGSIEVGMAEVNIENAADQLPLQVNSDEDTGEEIRLRYRYLDLRREKVARNILLRNDVIASIRRRMIAADFKEFQTPILTASSPEGARDYLVPSRLHPGKFYALPQAPQQFKQLLMVAGFDKYFQIAPCFRDEDARADRSPGEFYQLDFEMAYATQDDVFNAIEPVIAGVFEEFAGFNRDAPWSVTPTPFPRIPYAESMLKYGNDKPDLRNPIEIADVAEVFAGSDFKIFAGLVEKGGTVRAIPAPGGGSQPRSWFDKLNDWSRDEGAPGLGYIVLENGEGKGPIAKFVAGERLEKLKQLAGLKDGDAVFFSAGDAETAADLAGKARTKIGQDLDLIPTGRYDFCWIVDYPMYEKDKDTGAIEFSHNPFSMPQGEMAALDADDPLDVLAYQYDIVCNGVELSSGAIRNHRPDIMLKAFEIAGYDRATVEREFAGMFNAFRYGAPPHGGSAPGIDRIVMLIADEPNIREVIAFPMNQRAEDLMMGAPAEVDDARLRELHLKKVLPKGEK